MLKNLWALFCLGFAGSLLAAPSSLDMRWDLNSAENLMINNRVLLKVNGKSITVLDVVRKMDLLFYRQYPELADSIEARYQFYTVAWKSILSNVIDDSLIVADAEEKSVTISDGEVREELEALFGPDVVLTLEKLNMTLEEAFELLKIELTVRRMTGMMVRSKAMIEVHPTQVRQRYEMLLKEQPPQDVWVYHLISIRGEGHQANTETLLSQLRENKMELNTLLDQMRQTGLEISYSDEYKRLDQELSAAHKSILASLQVGEWSAPINKPAMSQLFFLKSFEKGEAPSFKQVEEEIKQTVIQERVAHYQQQYRDKLRKQYGFTNEHLSQSIPENFQPFALR